MKILVVDDDLVARKVLSAFLKQSNYEMQIMEDGLSAFRAMTEPDAPSVAIIDWVMPDLSGPELCAKLRAHPFAVQPYLIMLSGRKEKCDIVAALDAGANDFIVKPFNIQETQARLRVAHRAILEQYRLRQRIADLEAELAASRHAPPPPRVTIEPPAPTIASEPPPGVESAGQDKPLRIPALEPDQLATVVAGALRHSGEYAAPRPTSRGSALPRVVGWTGMLLVREALWLDLLLEIDDMNLRTFFVQSHARPPVDATELVNFCTRVQTALRDSMRSVLRAMGSTVLAPLPALPVGRAFRPCPALPAQSTERHHYKVGAAMLTLTTSTSPSPLWRKTAEELQPFDILAEAYPSTATHQLPLLRGGAVLTEQVIERLRLFTQSDGVDAPPIIAHEPSAVALHYCWEAQTARRVRAELPH